VSLETDVARLREEVGALVASHDRRHSIDAFSLCADAPSGFISDITKGVPWEKQIEIALAVRDNARVVVRSCNSAGKDWLAARLALWWVYAHKGLVLITGPTERQVKNIVMGEVRRAFAAAEDLPGDLYEMALRVDRTGHAGIIAFTSTDSSKHTGFHAPRVMVIITEGQAVEPFAYEGLLACATGAEDRVLVLGNPLAPEGKFFDISRAAHWRSFRISALEHPNVIEGREVIPGGVTREFIETITREYGIGSGQYRARVEGEFPDEGDETLVRRSWLDAAAARWESGEWQDEVEGQPLVFALDVARYGADHSVLAVRQGHVLREFVTWAQADLMESVGRVTVALERFGVNESSYEAITSGSFIGRIVTTRGPKIIVDEVGIGSGALDRLRERGFRVSGFNGGRSPTAGTPERQFANRRAESYWQLRRLLEEGRIALPRDEKLFDELAATRWKVNSTGRVQIEPKDDLRTRIGRSPDRADALAMAFADFAPLRTSQQRQPVRW
jgi:phage terminase large subunit